MESSMTVQKLKTCVPLFWIWPFIFILITLAVLVFTVSSACLKNVLLFTFLHLSHFLNACTLGLFSCFPFGLLFFYYEGYQNSAFNKNIGLMCACIYGCQTVWCNLSFLYRYSFILVGSCSGHHGWEQSLHHKTSKD